MNDRIIYKNAKLRHQKELYDIVIEDGIFKEIGKNLNYPEIQQIDLEGRLVCEPYVESHIHLDYVYTASIPDVLTKEDIKKRAYLGIKTELEHGVQYIRTHVDVTDPALTAFKAMLEVKEEVKDLVDIQLIAFPQEGMYAYKDGDKLVEEAIKMGADVVGGIPHFEFTREDGVISE